MRASVLVVFECGNVIFNNENTNDNNNNNNNKANQISAELVANIDENVQSHIIEPNSEVQTGTATVSLSLNSNQTPDGNSCGGLRLRLASGTSSMEKQFSSPENSLKSNRTDKFAQLEEIKMALSNSSIKQLSELRLIPLGVELMQLIYQRKRTQKRHGNDAEYLSSVVVSFLRHFASVDDFSDSQFNAKIHVLFPN